MIGDWRRGDGPSGREGTSVLVGSWDLFVADDRSIPQHRRAVYWPGGNRADRHARSRLTVVDDDLALQARRVAYWDEAWEVAISILRDSVCGELPSPFDFGDVGYTDRAMPDIGVSLLGFPLENRFLHPRLNREIVPPETWPELRDSLAVNGEGVVFSLGYEGRDSEREVVWVANLVSLRTGEKVEPRIAWGTSTDSVVSAVMMAR